MSSCIWKCFVVCVINGCLSQAARASRQANFKSARLESQLAPFKKWYGAQRPPQLLGHSYEHGNPMIANFLKSISIDKEPEQPSSSHFHTISQPDSSEPTSNNFLAPTTWKLLLHDLERQVAHSAVLLPKTHLQPRDEGAFLFWERSDWFQSVSRSCVDAAADPFTVHGLFCSAVIDFGMSIMIAAKTVQDSAICAVMGQVSGDELLCLSWMVFRTAFPGVLPDFFDADLPYSKQRNIPK